MAIRIVKAAVPDTQEGNLVLEYGAARLQGPSCGCRKHRTLGMGCRERRSGTALASKQPRRRDLGAYLP